MRTSTKALGTGIGLIVLVFSGIGVSATASSTPGRPGHNTAVRPNVDRPDKVSPTISTDNQSDEAILVPIAPCRIVDTRIAGGLLKTARTFTVGGTTGFSTQGGNSTGCGVPVGATAIAANVVAVTPTSGGYVKAYPAGTAAPSASVINFRKDVTIANELTLKINPVAAASLTLSASQKTHIVIDLTGYYQPQIAADIESAGVFFGHSSRVLSVTHTVGSGFYAVAVDRPVEGPCAAQATPLDTGNFASAITESGGIVNVRTWHLVSGVVTAGDDEFNLTVTC